ncbi:MAG: cell wall hydrolase [Novosphingobium sp.]
MLALAAALAVPGTAQAEQAAGPSEQDLRCLTLAVAYEAGNQTVAGQEAVAEVVLNRTRSPSFPRSVCDVVFQGVTRGTGCQFTFACDGAIDRRLPMGILAGARAVAERVAGGSTAARVAGALNYHADYVNPVWAARLDRVARIGAHIFYRPLPGQLAEGARAPLTPASVGAGAGEGEQAIRRYAGYFAGLQPLAESAASASAARGGDEKPATDLASRGPFLPWGLALR